MVKEKTRDKRSGRRVAKLEIGESGTLADIRGDSSCKFESCDKCWVFSRGDADVASSCKKQMKRRVKSMMVIQTRGCVRINVHFLLLWMDNSYNQKLFDHCINYRKPF